MTKKLKKICWYSFLAAEALLLLFCTLACLSPFVNPGSNAFIALLGMGFPLLFGGVLVYTIYRAIKKTKFIWIHIVIVILSIYQLSMVAGLNAFTSYSPTKAANTLRIATWNLSSWGTTKRNNENKISYRTQMINLLNATNADVICLQEYHFLREKTFRDTLIPELKEKGFVYFFFARSKYTMHLFKSAHVTGVAIASKYPITNTAQFDYSNEEDHAEPLIYADIQFNATPIRIFTTHLESVRFEAYDYEALHNLKAPANASITQTRAVAWKLKQAYKRRAAQATFLHEKIEQSPHPVIVCGDFNDVPGSYAYHTAKGNLQDAFLEKGFGLGRTYRFISPTLRIDYILADKKFKVEQYKKMEVNYSDHYAVVADVKITE